MNLNFVAAGIMLAAAGGWLLTHDFKTVQKERARVQDLARQKDDRAQMARRRIDASPAASVLAPYYRD